MALIVWLVNSRQHVAVMSTEGAARAVLYRRVSTDEQALGLDDLPPRA
jgi:hypothetical protein